eukprot:sb/3474242/
MTAQQRLTRQQRGRQFRIFSQELIPLEDADFLDLENTLIEQGIPALTSRDYKGRSLIITADNEPTMLTGYIYAPEDSHTVLMRVADPHCHTASREKLARILAWLEPAQLTRPPVALERKGHYLLFVLGHVDPDIIIPVPG